MRRWMIDLGLAAGFALTLGVAAPRPAFACSCVGPEPMGSYVGDPQKLVFTGTVRASGQAGVAIAVEEWFQGNRGAVLEFPGDGRSPGSFGPNGAGCQEGYPPIGSRWIWVATIPKPGEQPQINLCTPKAMLDTPEGAAMLADARGAFGGSSTPGTDVPREPATPAAGGDPTLLVAVAAGLVAAVLVLFGGVALVARRRLS
jgi:hypothetical protein